MSTPKPSRDATDRVGGETPENIVVEPPAGLSTSPEAMKVLREQGVDAWRAWVAEHAAPDE